MREILQKKLKIKLNIFKKKFQFLIEQNENNNNLKIVKKYLK